MMVYYYIYEIIFVLYKLLLESQSSSLYEDDLLASITIITT